MANKYDLNKIWSKGSIIRGKNPDLYRRDDLGNEMFKRSYGKDSEMGWSVDHKNPVSKGGSDNIRNLRPLNTSANKSKGNKYPHK